MGCLLAEYPLGRKNRRFHLAEKLDFPFIKFLTLVLVICIVIIITNELSLPFLALLQFTQRYCIAMQYLCVNCSNAKKGKESSFVMIITIQITRTRVRNLIKGKSNFSAK